MPDRRIRRAHLGDLPELLALESLFPTDRINRASFRHLLLRANADVLVYSRRGKVLGNTVVLYRRGSRRARLYSLVTHPDYRGKGIGAALVNAAEHAAREHGCTQAFLEVRTGNRVALALYKRLGYVPSARIKRFYDDGTDAVRLERTLLR